MGIRTSRLSAGSGHCRYSIRLLSRCCNRQKFLREISWNFRLTTPLFRRKVEFFREEQLSMEKGRG